MFYSEVINEIIVVFILIFSGFAAVRSNLISEDVSKALSDSFCQVLLLKKKEI
ncbi:MAG: hypothetical protein PWQ96_2359 [Clostridia bacterium]|jgi:predicted permease|nr:hypothetical protein [Clostridiales bacterium]MDK2986715.1 hypothetical protein [Clostridia bacterium]